MEKDLQSHARIFVMEQYQTKMTLDCILFTHTATWPFECKISKLLPWPSPTCKYFQTLHSKGDQVYFSLFLFFFPDELKKSISTTMASCFHTSIPPHYLPHDLTLLLCISNLLHPLLQHYRAQINSNFSQPYPIPISSISKRLLLGRRQNPQSAIAPKPAKHLEISMILL